MKERLLEDIGLTKSEVKVYLSLLDLGTSTTGPIVDKSKIASSKVYEILEKLIQKGLVSYIIKSGKKHFEAADPKRILDYMKEKKERLLQQEQDIKKILPQLELKRTISKNKSDATIYKGMKGLHTAFYAALDLLKKGEEHLVMGIPQRSHKVELFFARWSRERKKKGVKARILFDERVRGDMTTFPEHNPDAQIKYHPTQTTTPAAINIFKNRVLIFPDESGQDPLLIVIDNKNIADSFRTQFNLLWNQRVKTYEGQSQIRELFRESLGFGDYDALAEGMKIVDNIWGREFYKWLREEKRKKGIDSRAIIDERHKESIESLKSITKFKYIPNYKNPGPSFIYKDKVIIVNVSENPIAFLIEDKDVVESYQSQFNMLWEQDVTVVKGFGPMEDALCGFVKSLKGDSYNVIGAALGKEGLYSKFSQSFNRFHLVRQKHKKKGKLLFQQGHSKLIPKNNLDKYYKNISIKNLPFKSESPVAILTGQEKTLLLIQKEDPVTISIDNKEIADAFNKQFQSLWSQDVKILKGNEAIKGLFEEMVQAGHCDLIGARGYFIDRNLDYIKKTWIPMAKKKGFTMRNLVDPEVKGKLVTTLPFAETRYTLQKEFSELGVFWIFGDKVGISNWSGGEPIVVVIENKKIQDMYKLQFESLWNQDSVRYEGIEGVKQLLNSLLDTEDKEFLQYGGTSKSLEFLGDQFWHDFNKRSAQKNIEYRLIFHSSLRDWTKKNLISMKHTQVRFTQTNFEGITSTMICGNKVGIVVYSSKPFGILIESPEIVKSYKKFFESIWNQDSVRYEGIEGMRTAYFEALEATPKGSETFVYGASVTSKEADEVFLDYNKARAKKGVGLKILFNQETIGSKHTRSADPKFNKNAQIRFIPHPTTPVNFEIFPDRVLMVTASSSNPVTTVMKNKEVVESFKLNFKELWNRKTMTYYGEAGVRAVFDLALNEKEIWAIGGNDGIKKYFPKYFNEWNKKRVQNKVEFHDLIDSKLLDQLYDRSKKVPYYKYKILPPELNSPHVIWIVGDSVANIIWGEETIITVTHDKEIANSYKKYFKYLWKTIK